MTDGGEGEATEVEEVEGEFDSDGGGSDLSGRINGITGQDMRSITDDGGGGGVGSAVVCSHCYVYSSISLTNDD